MTDELKEKLVLVRHRLQEMEETRAERWKECRASKGSSALLMNTLTQAMTVAMTSETGRGAAGIYQRDILRAAREDDESFVEEVAFRERERNDFKELLDQELRDDVGCSVSGLYDLVGTYVLAALSIVSALCFGD